MKNRTCSECNNTWGDHKILQDPHGNLDWQCPVVKR